MEGENTLFEWSPVDENNECLLDLSAVVIPTGTHYLSLEVSDGLETATDYMILTIENSPPHAVINGGGVYEIGSDVTIGGSAWDFDGDLLDYQWKTATDILFSDIIFTVEGGIPVILPDYTISGFSPGSHVIMLQIDDGINEPITTEVTIEIVDTSAPVLSIVASHGTLWPPNHKMVDILIETDTDDNSGLPVILSAEVTSSEPIDGLGDGDTAPDWTERSLIRKQASSVCSFVPSVQEPGLDVFIQS